VNPALAVALAALALGAAPKPIPEAKIGLARGGPAEVLVPPAVKENESAPGDRPLRARAYPGAAPAVPHGVADHLPITKDQNACVDCHAVAEKKKGEPTPIPASHYTDLRNAPEKRQEKVVGARWVCTACHVPQHDVAPLVKSPFPR
jgi:cytochrome c-type protein NapB